MKIKIDCKSLKFVVSTDNFNYEFSNFSSALKKINALTMLGIDNSLIITSK